MRQILLSISPQIVPNVLTTDSPILVNTSFNVRSEPIVCTPEDAFRCFMGTEIDMLVVSNAVLRKEDQESISFPFCRLGRRVQFGVTADTSDSDKGR